MRPFVLIAMCLTLNACACALDDDDRAAGKPPLWQCFVANSLKSYACQNGDTDRDNCLTQPTMGK